MTRTALVAVGGNALIRDANQPEVLRQWDAIRQTSKHLADMVQDGWTLILTHGNGPQAGFILRRNELAAHTVHTTPLDLIVADTQGAIGYMMQQALRNELYSRGIRQMVVTVITQVLVMKDDPAFANPTKPIGGFMSEAEARKFEAEGWQVVSDAGRGWRRVVASPQPLRIMEEEAIVDLMKAGNIVIAAGGGGIPVIHNEQGELREVHGVYAVIDKDRASAVLANRVHADLLVIATGVEKVSLHYNTPQQQDLAEVTAAEMRRYLAEGHFAPGSMLPKIEAVLEFLDKGGAAAVITDPPNMARALRGETGTWIRP